MYVHCPLFIVSLLCSVRVSTLTSTQVRMFALEVIVRTHLLNQLVVDAEERDEDADDLEGLGAEPGGVRLGVLREARLRRVVQAGLGFLGAVGVLVLHPAVEGLGLLGVDGGLVGLLQLHLHGRGHPVEVRVQHLELHHLGGRHDADRHVAQAGGVVAEVDGEGPVDVVHDLPRHQQAELLRLHVEVEIAPAQDFLGLGRRFARGAGGFGFGGGAVQELVHGLGQVLGPTEGAGLSQERGLGFSGDDL